MPSNEIMSMEGQLIGMPLAGPETFSQQQLDYLKRALGVDETVLYAGSSQSPTLSDSIWNYEKILLCVGDDTSAKTTNSQLYYTADIVSNGKRLSIAQTCKRKDGGYFSMAAHITVSDDGLSFTVQSVGGWASWDNNTCGYERSGTWAPRFSKIVGIHRIAGGN